MNKYHEIYLPGLNKQLQAFVGENDVKDKKVLVVGANSAQIAKIIALETENVVNVIVEDYNSLMNTKLDLDGDQSVLPALMDFEVTDFKKEEFDFIYAQASISNSRRNKIVKELKRILKPEGIFCVGEVVKLEEDVPTFVQNIFESSDLAPFLIGDSLPYYEERKFELIKKYNFSDTMKKFYTLSNDKLIQASDELSDDEKKYYKKLLKQVSHESGAYLKQGADRYIGFTVLVLKKLSNNTQANEPINMDKETEI